MLVEVGVLSVVLARSPHRWCEEGESVFHVSSNSLTLVLTAPSDPIIIQGADLESALAKDLACVEEVRHVLIEHAEQNLLVWIAVDNPTRDVRERVFQKELSLIEGFPEVYFDFNIVPGISDPRQIASNAKAIYSREI